MYPLSNLGKIKNYIQELKSDLKSWDTYPLFLFEDFFMNSIPGGYKKVCLLFSLAGVPPIFLIGSSKSPQVCRASYVHIGICCNKNVRCKPYKQRI